MVRVISEKLFSPPRSRHSSGEALDKELAARAVEALSSLDSRKFDFSDYESSSDSHWDSEIDAEGDSQDGGRCFEENGGTEDVVRKRKERRRERNKLSAQAYRNRRREQSVNTQKVLTTLEEENVRLKTMVQNLEQKISKTRTALKRTMPLPPSDLSPSNGFMVQSPCLPNEIIANSNARLHSSACKLESPGTGAIPRNGQPVSTVDNDRVQQLQVNALTDNFHFSKVKPTSMTPPSAMAVPFCFSASATIDPSPSTFVFVNSSTEPSLINTAITTTTTSTTTTEGESVIHRGLVFHADHNANAAPSTWNNRQVTWQSDNVNNNNMLKSVPGSSFGMVRAQPTLNLNRAS